MAIIVIFSGLLWSGQTFAWRLEEWDLSRGYSGCSWQDNGETSTLTLSIDYRSYRGNDIFTSRAILLYAYDRYGNVRPSSNVADAVYLNGVRHGDVYSGDGYTLYKNNTSWPAAGDWMNGSDLVAEIKIEIPNFMIWFWPAISVRAGNYVSGNDQGEIKGAAYLSRFGTMSNCKIVDPVAPPPPPEAAIDVSAPDWNLGELAAGDDIKTLSGSADRLCFTYVVDGIAGKRFIINATNANGVLNNRYRLRKVGDASQLVPYNVTLDSGTWVVPLPNASNTTLYFDRSGKTCFVPTFKTTVGPSVTGGDYSDVLTFTVVTQS